MTLVDCVWKKMTRTCNHSLHDKYETDGGARARLRNWHLLSNDKLLPFDTFIFRRSVAVWSSFAWYVPNMYYYREQINSLSTIHASTRRFVRVGKRRLARHIDIVGLPTFAHVGRINRKSNRRSDEWMNRLRQNVQNFTCRDSSWVYGGIIFFMGSRLWRKFTYYYP